MKNQKGITLIALVITIIVLLILAAVSIAMLTGDNGILSNAQKAQTETVTKSNEEVLKLAVSDVIADYYANGNTGAQSIDVTALKNSITSVSNDYGEDEVTAIDDEENEGNIKVTFTKGDVKVYYVSETTGEISTSPITSTTEDDET